MSRKCIDYMVRDARDTQRALRTAVCINDEHILSSDANEKEVLLSDANNKHHFCVYIYIYIY